VHNYAPNARRRLHLPHQPDSLGPKRWRGGGLPAAAPGSTQPMRVVVGQVAMVSASSILRRVPKRENDEQNESSH